MGDLTDSKLALPNESQLSIPENEQGSTLSDSGARLDVRKATILRSVVQEHIVTGQPVGSGHLANAPGLAVSSATIRNEMSVLEREGYLTHRHTSAGRIPTDRGYRYFVDSITEPDKLSEQNSAQVRRVFDTAVGDIEQLMLETSRLLADLTDYASVVLVAPSESITVRSVQVVDLGNSALIVIVLSNGSVEKAPFELSGECNESTLNAATARLSTLLLGKPFAAVRDCVLLSTGEPKIDAICQAAIAALRPRPKHNEQEAKELFLGGASRMVSAFDTVATVRRVLATLEEQYVVVNLVREALLNPARVSIGVEHGAEQEYESLLSCSVVVAPFTVDGTSTGTVGVLGPTRMDYRKAIAAVGAVGEALTEHLS